MNTNKRITILLILTQSLFFTACSSKQSPSPTVNETNTSKEKLSLQEDEFGNEFEEEDKEIFDPLEGYNRWMTSVNDSFYLNVFNPISKGYAYVIPKPARVGVSNAFDNLKFPLRFANNLLQFKFDASMKELGRFMINSTVGLLGFIDVAKMGGVEPQEEDFGQTLGYYGVGSGFHVVLPFFGPSNLRDAMGLSVDTLASPLSNGPISYQIPENLGQSVGTSALYYTNKNSLHLGKYENLKKDALDTYTFFRDSYEQMRTKEIAK
jgi:phospholipid-binding lipoprotein MlaA